MNQCIMLRESHKHCLCKRNILYLKNVFTNVQVMRSNSTVRKNCLLYVTMKILMIFLWPWLFKVRFFFSSVVLSFPNSLCILDLSWPSSGSEEGLDWRASLEFVLGSFCWRSIRTDWTANGRKRTNFPHLLFFFRMETFFITNR